MNKDFHVVGHPHLCIFLTRLWNWSIKDFDFVAQSHRVPSFVHDDLLNKTINYRRKLWGTLVLFDDLK